MTIQKVKKREKSRNPRECAEAKISDEDEKQCLYVATRANALWQRYDSSLSSILPIVATRANALRQRSSHRAPRKKVAASQPARMRCGKVAPLLCPNRKLRKYELRSSFLVSPSVILVVTFYMIAQLLKRFNTCTAKTAASKLSDAAVYSFNK